MSFFMIVLFIVIAGTFSGFEIGGYLLNRLQLRFRVRHENRAACRLQSVISDSHLFIFTVLIGHNIAVYLVSRSVTQLYLDAGVSEGSGALFGVIPWNAETAATVTLLLPLFLFAEVIPKNIFRRNADFLMYRLSAILLFSWRLFLPITMGLRLLFRLLTGSKERSDMLSGVSLSVEGLREYFSEESRKASLSTHQHGMIEKLVSMHRIPVRDLMRPVSSIISISDRAVVREAFELMRSQDVEQVAVYSGSIRRINGFLTLFDLMDPQLGPADPIKPLVRKMIRLPVTQPVTRAFRRLRQSPGALAVVTDRAFLAVGMLYLRDIAQYIVSNDAGNAEG